MPYVKDRVDVTIYRDPAAYTSHPCVARLRSGDYLAAFNESLPRRPYMHPPSDPRFVNLVARSRDGGQTWLPPRVAPGYEFTGVECPSITQISTGEVMLVQWQFSWFPLETARKLAARGDSGLELSVRNSTGQWVVAESDADWEGTALPWARGDSGVFVSLSSDDGATWDRTVKVGIAPFRRGYSPRPPTELADGTLLLALGSHVPAGVNYVVRSTDHGRTWEPPAAVPSNAPDLSEPTILALPSGKVILLAREETTGLVHQNDSYDGGLTWTPVRRTDIWGYPQHLIRLSDGRLFVVYGIRRPPYGIRACLSQDEGQTWDYGNELIIRDDMKNRNLGYPTALEEEDGRVFVAYYGEDAEGVTFIIGSHFSIP